MKHLENKMPRLARREILECLARQGVRGVARLKSSCRDFERYWEARMHGRI